MVRPRLFFLTAYNGNMTPLYFTISELCITDDDIEQIVADKLVKYHISQVNPIRAALGAPVWASQNSGFRSKKYERLNGRSPDGTRDDWSRHTFTPLSGKDPDGKGAVDWTTESNKMMQLGLLLVTMTDYSRICFYPDGDADNNDDRFFHCDYGFEDRGQRIFINKSGWQEMNDIKSWLNKIS